MRLSAWGNLFMALFGCLFAVLSKSEAILLDGVFSLISFFMSLLALKVSRLVEAPDSENFNFGYAHFEPIFNAIKGLIVLTICALSMVSAVEAILHGGRQISSGAAIFYAVIASAGCLIIAYTQHHYSKKTQSPLIAVDYQNWLIDGLISLVALAAFICVYLVKGTSWASVAPYIDPALVTGMVLFMIRIPVVTVLDNVKEILYMAPDKETRNSIRAILDEAVDDIELSKYNFRLSKVGRFLFVQVHLVVSEDFELDNIARLDAIRSKIYDKLIECHPRLIIDVIFTGEERWIR